MVCKLFSLADCCVPARQWTTGGRGVTRLVEAWFGGHEVCCYRADSLEQRRLSVHKFEVAEIELPQSSRQSMGGLTTELML
jgi:hypothetical protein